VLALIGTATLAIANFGFGNSSERALTERLDALSTQVRSLEQAIPANELKAGPPDAVKALQVQQVQTDALVATLAKDVEALRSHRKATPPPPKNRAKAKAAH
jgi:outer membrane murein-binding lipoprotein Lpp